MWFAINMDDGEFVVNLIFKRLIFYQLKVYFWPHNLFISCALDNWNPKSVYLFIRSAHYITYHHPWQTWMYTEGHRPHRKVCRIFWLRDIAITIWMIFSKTYVDLFFSNVKQITYVLLKFCLWRGQKLTWSIEYYGLYWSSAYQYYTTKKHTLSNT